ncbi:MAG: spoIIIJ-associated protein [Frankiaceae bacterium]|nr:spoIIIJ-associated protein [Frankiaceae bacterium]MDQ1673533.1 spoIIIJ-associated protein [Frankiaceae bacterium]
MSETDTSPESAISAESVPVEPGTATPLSPAAPAHDPVRDLEQEGEYAADYLEALLDILDLDGDLDLDVEGGRAAVAIVGSGLDILVGDDGETLDALQDLTRLAVQQQSGARSRLMLDVAGHRARRRVKLSEIGTAAANRVVDSGKAERLSPMSPFERKVVHDAVAAVEGVHSESEGEEPQRRVVVLPD